MKLLAHDAFINHNQFFDLGINLERETAEHIIKKYQVFKTTHQIKPKLVICGTDENSVKLNKLLGEDDRMVIA